MAWTDDESDPQYAMSTADLALLEKETDAKGRHFIIHKLPIPAVRQVVTEEDLLVIPTKKEKKSDTQVKGLLPPMSISILPTSLFSATVSG